MHRPTSDCADAIADNHGHTLTVAKTGQDCLVDETCSIQGARTHNHTLSLTVARLGTLKAGTAATGTTSTTGFHSHAVTAGCV